MVESKIGVGRLIKSNQKYNGPTKLGGLLSYLYYFSAIMNLLRVLYKGSATAFVVGFLE